MKKQTRLYNMLLPIWLLWLVPAVWLVIIPGNLAIDCAVLLLAMAALKMDGKKAALKQVWWKLWLLGFAADAAGVAWMILGMVPGWFWWDTPFGTFWKCAVGNALLNPFSSPAAFLWTLVGVAIAGALIFLLDRRVLCRCPQTADRADRLALVLAVVTAPWLFFIPAY